MAELDSAPTKANPATASIRIGGASVTKAMTALASNPRMT